MSELNNKRKSFFANQFHREIFRIVFWATFIPMMVSIALVLYMVLSVLANEMVFPEAIAYNILPAAKKTLLLLAFGAPVIIGVILAVAYKVTHKIVGPYDRILRELDHCVKGTKKDGIKIREDDRFWPLVDKINQVIAKSRG